MANRNKATVKENGNGLEISGTAAQIIDTLNGAMKRQRENVSDLDDVDDDEESAEVKIEIVSATLKENFCNYSYELTVGTVTDTLKRNGGALIHDDLKLAFAKMGIHLAVICEQMDDSVITDIDFIPLYKPQTDEFDVLPEEVRKLSERASHFYVSAFRIEGTGEKQGVKLAGTMRLSTGEFVPIESPKREWQTTSYKFINELLVLVQNAQDEVLQYMNGKHAPKFVQQEMSFGDDEPGQNEKPQQDTAK